ncbi:MAG: type II/IV secretion system ATPase subunit [Candidatus Diapherotrites archaeon]|nr:type II/IV secretion system ATPase subunit [Candidatus Diapherotrites archaeon]
MASGKVKVVTKGGKRYLTIDCSGSPYGPSIADYPQRMAQVIEALTVNDVDGIVLADVYERVYDERQTRMLKEIARLVVKFKKAGVWAPSMLGGNACSRFISKRKGLMVDIASNLLRTDPIRAYIKCLQAIDMEKAKLEIIQPPYKKCTQKYMETLEFVRANLEATELIQKLRNYIKKLKSIPPGRGFYRSILEAQLKPSFIGSRLIFDLPEEIELLDQYAVGDTKVSIYKHPERVEALYILDPPEYSLTPEQYFLMSKTKEIVSGYHPEGLEFTDLATNKGYFRKIYETTIADLANENNITATPEEIAELARIVVRYTIGFGMMGVLLSDEKLTDVYMDAPLGYRPVYVVHSDHGLCETNIIFSEEEAEGIISRFRSMSGRPFDEAHPIMDFDLAEYHARTATIGRPLSPDGIGFALRIHKSTPWTLPQFIDVKMLTPEVAGLLSFLIDSQASTLVVGSRGAGKTSMLMALMLEILRSQRIITIEDTLELPVDHMRSIGFKVCRLKTRSAISVGQVTAEVSPEDALRTALRLGESVLIVGEVRSKEALVLYEAMRVGAIGNVVMGTIHGENAYSVWDRVVNDLGVPNTSFKATDMCVTCAPIRFKGSLKRDRRLIEVTEIGKDWYEDPKKEGGLIDLVTYDAGTDTHKIHKDNILNNSHFFKRTVKLRGLDMEEIWNDIVYRGKVKATLVDFKNKYNLPELLESENTVEANDMYLLMQERSRQEVGAVEYAKVFDKWKKWVGETMVKGLLARRKSSEEAKG